MPYFGFVEKYWKRKTYVSVDRPRLGQSRRVQYSVYILVLLVLLLCVEELGVAGEDGRVAEGGAGKLECREEEDPSRREEEDPNRREREEEDPSRREREEEDSGYQEGANTGSPRPEPPGLSPSVSYASVTLGEELYVLFIELDFCYILLHKEI